jgi:TonB-dependent receptor
VIAALEVTKALTPDMDGDAIAGQINIVTQSALDRDGMILRASLGLGEFELGSGDNQRATATVGNRFGPDGNFGLLVAASASKAGRYTDNVEHVWFRDDDTGEILPEVTEIKDYEGERTRRGVTARFDARLDEDNLVYFIASGSKFKDEEYRNTFTIEYERFTPGSTGTSGEAGRATFDKEIRERVQEQSINTVNLGGEHWMGDWRFDWQGSYSKGELELPARQQLIYRSTLRPRMLYDFSNPDFPRFTILNSDGSVRQEGINLPESLYAFRRYNQRYEKAEEEELGLRLDATRPQSFFGESGDIAFGLRLRQKDKDSNDDRRRNSVGPAPAYVDTLCPRVSNNFGQFEFGRVFCNNVFSRFVPQLDNANLLPLVADSIVSDYEASEDISAAYFRLDARWDRLSMIAGARYEYTDAEGRAAEFNADTGIATPVVSSRTYGEFLPSVHFRYEFDEDTILRWSYSTGLSRPNFNQFVPRLVISEDDREVEAGNPNIRATTSQNLDLSIEHYIRPLGLVSAGVFYKRLDNPIFVVNSDVVGGPFDGLNLTQPANGDGGSIRGMELAWQQTFEGLPAPWDGLGVYANYTYANSDADLPLGLGSTDLPGTSEHNANFAVFYEKHGLNLRLAYNYRSEYLQEIDISDSELDVYWDERAILDFTASYQIGPNWQVFAEVNNINDTEQRRYQGNPGRVLELEQFGRFWMVGASFEY